MFQNVARAALAGVVAAALALPAAVAARHAGEQASVGPPDTVFLGARGDRILCSVILVMGIIVILVRYLGHLLLSLGAFALLTPLLFWPPCWPELRILLDAARRDAENDRDET